MSCVDDILQQEHEDSLLTTKDVNVLSHIKKLKKEIKVTFFFHLLGMKF